MKRVGEILREDVVFEAKEFGGTFSIDPRSHLLHRLLRYGSYEPRISSLFLSLINPENDFVDVGANIGFYTIGGAKKLTVGRVLAAEPSTGAFARLSENVLRNGLTDRVVLFKGLIGATRGQAKIHYVNGLEEYASMYMPIEKAIRDEEIKTENVPMERLDDLVAAHALKPSLLKVDVEGSEYSVFSGAQKVLSTFRPVVISELWRNPPGIGGKSGADIIRMFEALDYVVVNPEDPHARPGLRKVGEILCVPKEQYAASLLS